MHSEPFDVVVIPFPFTDRRATKRRPALVVSSADFNEAHEKSILAMITSTMSKWPSDVALRDWRRAGFNIPCKVRLKLVTLDDALILRRVGTLSKRDSKAVKDGLSCFLAIQ